MESHVNGNLPTFDSANVTASWMRREINKKKNNLFLLNKKFIMYNF